MNEIFDVLSKGLSANILFASLAALGWGIVSIVFSPCHLSSIPLIVGYISSQRPNTSAKRQQTAFALSFVFAFGIFLSIILIGVLTSASGRLMGDVGRWGNYMVAFIFLIVALYLLDVIQLNWNIPVLANTGGMTGAFFLGLLFGVGLGPCTFAYMAPVLGVVFTLADENLVKAMILVAAFGIGQSAVIVFAGSYMEWVQKYLKWDQQSRTSIYIRKISGVLVLLGGVYFVFTTF